MINAKIIQAAIEGFRNQQKRIEAQIQELKSQLPETEQKPEVNSRPKRHLSPEGRKAISEAMKARWRAKKKAAASGR